MCAALPAEWWRGEYSNSIIYVVIDGTVRSYSEVFGLRRRIAEWIGAGRLSGSLGE